MYVYNGHHGHWVQWTISIVGIHFVSIEIEIEIDDCVGWVIIIIALQFLFCSFFFFLYSKFKHFYNRKQLKIRSLRSKAWGVVWNVNLFLFFVSIVTQCLFFSVLPIWKMVNLDRVALNGYYVIKSNFCDNRKRKMA